MSDHTEGLLHVDPEEPWDIVDSKGRVLASFSGAKTTDTEDIANARRMVACWNLCNGIPTEKLEKGDFLIICDKPMREEIGD